MTTIVLEPKQNITLRPVADEQYVIIPRGSVEIEIILEKSGISAELLAVYALKDSEEVTLSTKSVHTVPNTTCTVSVKAALFDSSKSDYKGEIIIQKPAQQTSSYLEDNVLVIGEKAKNNSQPILEIEADDVKASHGATTGRIDEGHVYYLMSRGLEREEAEQLIISGFFESVLARVKDEEIKVGILEKLNV